MSDVLLSLVIFVGFASSPFIGESALKVHLAEASAQSITNNDGNFIINGVAIESSNKLGLVQHLEKAVGDNTDPHIIIRADNNTKYQNIVTATDTAQQLDYTQLTMVTKEVIRSK